MVKLIQFNAHDYSGYGVLEKNRIQRIEGDIFNDFTIQHANSYDPDLVTVLPPVWPSKIVAVGINYRDHAREMGHDLPDEPVLFLKPSTSVIGHGEDILYPESSLRVDYEAEIAAVVKKKAYKVRVEEAAGYILGYTCLNDVTARDLQRKDGQWTRAKSFDTFCPLGPVIQTQLNPNNVRICSRLNGELRQNSNTKNFIFPLFELFSYVSHIMTLLPGDIVTTGTPSGIGEMKPGDTVEIEIEGIGILKNKVISGAG